MSKIHFKRESVGLLTSGDMATESVISIAMEGHSAEANGDPNEKPFDH